MLTKLKYMGNSITLMKKKLFLIILNQLNFVFTYALLLLFASLLSVEDFGVLSYIKNIMSVSLVFVVFGLDRAGLYLFKDNVFYSYPYANMTRLLLSFIAVCLMYIYFSLNRIVSLEVVTIMALYLIVSAFNIKYIFDITKKIEYEIYFSYLRSFPFLIFLLFYIALHFQVSVNCYVALMLAGIILYISFQYIFFKIPPKIKFDIKRIEQILKYSNYVWIGTIASNINNYADSFMIMDIIGKEETGIYSFSYMFYTGMLMLTALPLRMYVSEMINRPLDIKDVHRYSFNMFLFSIIVFLFGYILYPVIIDMFFQKYSDSVKTFDILALSFIIVSVTSIYGHLLISKGFSKFYALSMVVTAILNIIMNFFVIKRYGIEGAAYTTLISTSIAMVFTYYLFKIKVNA